MKHRTLFLVIGIVTVGLFSMSLFVSAQPQKGNINKGQRNQGQEEPGMQPGMDRGEMGRRGGQPDQGRGGQDRDGQGRGGQERGGQGMRMNWQALELTEEQQAQLQQIQREFRLNTATLREELRYAQQDLRTEMQKDAVDQAKIDSLLNQIASLKQRMSEAETQNFLAIKGILTPEQVEKLAAISQRVPSQLRGVDLTTEQQAQISAIMEASREKSQAAREEMRDLRDQLQELLLASGETDAAKVQQVQSAIAAKEAEMEKDRVNMFLQIKALLTPEQQEQMKQGGFEGRNTGGKQGQNKQGGNRK